MIEIESMPYCLVDMKPIDMSPAFKQLCGIIGEQEAMHNFTYDQRLNVGTTEIGCSHVRSDCGDARDAI